MDIILFVVSMFKLSWNSKFIILVACIAKPKFSFAWFLFSFFNFGVFCCPCSLECIYHCISFRRLNNDVDVALGKDQANERNQEPVCGRNEHTEVDETHSPSIRNQSDVKGTVWGIAAQLSRFVACCLRTVSLDQRLGDEFDRALCDGSDAGRCS